MFIRTFLCCGTTISFIIVVIVLFCTIGPVRESPRFLLLTPFYRRKDKKELYFGSLKIFMIISRVGTNTYINVPKFIYFN